MARFWKSGSLGTDASDVICLSTSAAADGNYAALWKPGVLWSTGNAYQIPSGKKLSLVALQVSPLSSTAASYAISLGYADNAQTQGIGGGGTAPTGSLTNVWGDTAAATYQLMGGFSGQMNVNSLGSFHGNSSGPIQWIAHDMWPVAAATKYPFIRHRSSANFSVAISLWVIEV